MAADERGETLTRGHMKDGVNGAIRGGDITCVAVQ